MKIKIMALAFSILFFGSITATSYAQVVTTANTQNVVVKDKDNKKTKKTNKAVSKSDCKAKKSCCSSAMLKDDACKEKEKKSDKDKK